ncbi:MAG: hypothetical protein AAF434_14280 [Pseudomonadota bacterium]
MRLCFFLLTYFFRLFLLRAKPQDVTGTPVTAVLTLIAVIVANVSIFSSLLGAVEALQRSILEQVILALALLIGLSMSGHRERFLQLYTALCGAGLVISLVSWPIYQGLESLESIAELGVSGQVAMLSLHVWSIIVMGHILRHGFDTRLSVGIMMSMVYVVSVITIAAMIFPAPQVSPVDAL